MTEEEVLRAECKAIGPASTREEDISTDEELGECLHALAASKATGPGDIPVEVWRASPTAKAALYNRVRQIIKGETLPEGLATGEFIMAWKGKGSSDDIDMSHVFFPGALSDSLSFPVPFVCAFVDWLFRP